MNIMMEKVKLWHHLHINLAVDGTLNTNTQTAVFCNSRVSLNMSECT